MQTCCLRVILFSFLTPTPHLPSRLLFLHNLDRFMLRVGHQNVYHLYNKVPDLCVSLSRSTPSYNIFGIKESRLDSRISDRNINIPKYCIGRKDLTIIGQTGMPKFTLKIVLVLKFRLAFSKGLNSDSGWSIF